MSRSSYQKAKWRQKNPRIVKRNNEFGTAAKACKTIRQSLSSIRHIKLPKHLTPRLNKLCLEMLAHSAGRIGERHWDALQQKDHLINFRWIEEAPLHCMGTCTLTANDTHITINCQVALAVKETFKAFPQATHFSFQLAALPTCAIYFDEHLQYHRYEADLFYRAFCTDEDNYLPVGLAKYLGEYFIEMPLDFSTKDCKTFIVLALATPCKETDAGFTAINETLIRVVDVVGVG